MKDAPEPLRAMPQADALGTNQSGMRAQNERLVLTLIRRHGALSKSEIARLTGLSVQTVSVIMRALEDERLILRGEPQRGRVGQPSVPMKLNPRGAFFHGLKIGRRSVEMVLTDFLGTILERRLRQHDYPDYDSVLRFALETAGDLVGALSADERQRVAGLGIAMPFEIWGWATVIGVHPEAMTPWKERDIKQDLSAALALPVFLQNDATAACSAELVFGTHEQPSDFLHFYVAFFIGGGVVLDGRLFQGPTGNAGAVGSMPVPDRTGRMRQLIDLASLVTLEKRLQAKGIDASCLWTSSEAWPLPEDILADWLDEAAQAIAHAVHGALAVLDFSAVKIDGWMPQEVRCDLAYRVASYLRDHDLTGLVMPDIQEGSIGPDARALGAASQPLLARFLVAYLR
ncbi:ROK family transcriptional regulator [Roseicyclus marinus]|uniref:ROK family transcriptional regulator n=1 Tax=Roseicyclus marinus TaxID=2161673 RepID=UPI00240EF72C|nr:ROK family transcriptional regulator [Roseicyclus marinus]MDG3043010.1 ROK family transcriptional regulator [Roseicyclus marinus]